MKTVTNRSLRFRQFLPREKGAYGVLGEPLILGLLAGYSQAGIMLVMVAILSLFFRESLFHTFTSSRQKKSFQKMNLILVLTMGCGLVLTAHLSGGNLHFLIPLGIMAPFFVIQVWADVHKKSRALVFEVVGVLVPGGFACALVLASGASVLFGLTLWGLCIARALPTFFYVRTRVRRLHRASPNTLLPLILHYGVFLGAFLLVWQNLLPEIVLWVMAFLVLRMVMGLRSTAKQTSAKRLGYSELVYGIVSMVVIGLGLA